VHPWVVTDSTHSDDGTLERPVLLPAAARRASRCLLGRACLMHTTAGAALAGRLASCVICDTSCGYLSHLGFWATHGICCHSCLTALLVVVAQQQHLSCLVSTCFRGHCPGPCVCCSLVFDCTPSTGCSDKQHVLCVQMPMMLCSGTLQWCRIRSTGRCSTGCTVFGCSAANQRRVARVCACVFSQHHIAISLCCDGHSGFHSGRDLSGKQRRPHVRRRQLFVCVLHIAFMVPC
jgi:hypothetical protein